MELHIFNTDSNSVFELLGEHKGVSVSVKEQLCETVVILSCAEEARNSINELTDRLRGAFGDRLYGTGSTTLQGEVVRELKDRGLKIASAESLTGGLVSKLITEVPGASNVIECGVCSYSNRIKHELLGVSQQTLDSFTEYSAETAREMAQGARRLSGADIGVSTTGVAGPGEDRGRPAGLVYVGVNAENYSREYRLQLNAGAGREAVRELASGHALFAVLLYLRNERGE